MADSTSNFRIGSRLALFGGVNLGQTGEDTSIKVDKTLVEITGDATGDTPVDKAIQGMNVTATVTFKQWSKADITDLISKVFAENTNASADRIDVGHETNTMLSLGAATLVLRPRNAAADGTTAAAEEFILWKAVATDVGEVAYNNQEQVGVTVTFMGLIDSTNGLFTFGDSAAS